MGQRDRVIETAHYRMAKAEPEHAAGREKSGEVILSRRDPERDRTGESATSTIAHVLMKDPANLAVRVTPTHAELIRRDPKDGENKCFIYELGPELRKAIKSCDAGGDFKPGKYDLLPPSPAFRAQDEREVSR